jgi:GNAT superfamily N-acetyltransferase
MSSSADSGVRYGFDSVREGDFDELVAIRIAAMRESLEQVGRFDPARARERLRRSFYPECTHFIVVDAQRVGFYALRESEDEMVLDHLYVKPEHQSRGIGSAVLRFLLAAVAAKKLQLKVGALRGSDSNRFYLRHGFRKVSEDEWDIYYVYGQRPEPQPA